MNRFLGNQRVTVNSPAHPMHAQSGTVWRLRRADNGAWVRMDDPPPPECREFPADDASWRGNHILLYPDQCEPSDG